MKQEKIRNVAIVAHVDHGKTTLVDGLLRNSGATEKVVERVMDNIDQEKERGITIRSKCVAIEWQGIRINLIDTPGHADFGGEVERVMGLADGVLLLVDAAEGPMPQTRFVLKKALEAGCQPLVVINKIDRPDSRLDEVLDEVFDLLAELDATDEQLDFVPIYASAKAGYAVASPEETSDNFHIILDAIVNKIPAPDVKYLEGDFIFQVVNLRHDKFVGRIALGRVLAGQIDAGSMLTRIEPDGKKIRKKMVKLSHYEGLQSVDLPVAQAGDIVEIAGFENLNLGDSLCSNDDTEPMPAISIDEPTLSINIRVNNSPFSGQDGKPLTSREMRTRLDKELLDNVALRVEETDRADTFHLCGRGLLHLSVLVETMRREGSEFLVGPPQILMKDKQEPWEFLSVEAPQECIGKVIEMIGNRKGEIGKMDNRGDYTTVEAVIPSRGILGIRTKILNVTRGEATFSHNFLEYRDWAGDIPTRVTGSLISMDTGQVAAYSLDNLNDRGTFFVQPQDKVYTGMVIGESNKDLDVEVNPCKAKQMSNMRSSGADRALKFSPKRDLSLEDMMEFLAADEWVEVTPHFLRIRKNLLDAGERKRAKRM